ncbi:hypothetical protein [Pseudomonas nitroreducens]|uniref:hypothetical protein n=1 Tax=Pseudomonas nitroreducens TaxID=46680 RepID=UPI00147D3C3E|nr:hypothetical protein [Pseudomonas nitroreducens]NNN24676.1 hypothetical protein [Pseudomonas nitroreducens]NNN24688.1 hypothetical protein [Pseudomonas nitroreducens]
MLTTWALVAIFEGQNAPSVFLKPTEDECRFTQVMIQQESKRTGKTAETACYAITPTPESVTNPQWHVTPKQQGEDLE